MILDGQMHRIQLRPVRGKEADPHRNVVPGAARLDGQRASQHLAPSRLDQFRQCLLDPCLGRSHRRQLEDTGKFVGLAFDILHVTMPPAASVEQQQDIVPGPAKKTGRILPGDADQRGFADQLPVKTDLY